MARTVVPGTGLALLALDAAGSCCSVAVAQDGRIVASETRPLRHGHAEVLLPMVDRVVARSGVARAAFGAVAATTGPGGFTGIRVGLAAAQGIALGLGVEPVGVTSFAAVAARVPPAPGALLVALDSRRADLYVQLFDAGGAGISHPRALLPADLAAYLDESPVGALSGTALRIAGDAAEAALVALAGRDRVTVIPGSAPDARGAAVAAYRLLSQERFREPLRPLYLRPPDVTLPKPRAPGR